MRPKRLMLNPRAPLRLLVETAQAESGADWLVQLDDFESWCDSIGNPRHDFWLYRRLLAAESLAPRFSFRDEIKQILSRAAMGLKNRDQATPTTFVLCGLVRQPVHLLAPGGLRAVATLRDLLCQALEFEEPQCVAEALLLQVCLASVIRQLDNICTCLQMAASRGSRVGPLLRHVSLQWCGNAFEGINRGLLEVGAKAGWDDWNPRNGIPFLEGDWRRWHQMPFQRELSHELTAAALIEVAWRLDSASLEDVKAADPSVLRYFTSQARDILQCGWLTLENLPFGEQRSRQRDRTITLALARLALLENNLGNFGLGSCYARFAWDRDSNHASKWGESAFSRREYSENDNRDDVTERAPIESSVDLASANAVKKALWVLMTRQMVDIPADRRFKFDGKSSQSAVAEFLLKGNPRLAPVFAAVHASIRTSVGATVYWNGINDEPLCRLIHDCDDEELTRLAFDGALHTGNIELIKEWILGGGERQRVRASFRDSLDKDRLKSSLSKHLRASDLLEYADLASHLYQQSLPVVSWQAFAKLRNSIRKVWKRCTLLSLTPMEQLFLHHAKVGFTQQALSNSSFRGGASAIVYESSEPDERARFVHEFSQKVRYRLMKSLRLQHFSKSTLAIPYRSVFVSLVSYDGHIAKALVFSREGIRKLEIATGDEPESATSQDHRDWHVELERFAEIASDCVIRKRPIDQAYTPSIVRLFKHLFLTAIQLEPNIQTLYVHSDSMFRQVPWQHTIYHFAPIRNFLRQELARLRNARLRWATPCYQLQICHIPGVNADIGAGGLGDANKFASDVVDAGLPSEWSIELDKEDPICRNFARELEKLFRGQQFRASAVDRLSIISHGEMQQRHGVIVAGDQGLGGDELMRRYGRRPVVALHVCHGGQASGNHLGDIGGLPAFFLAHGTRYLAACPLPVTLDAMKCIESHLAGISKLDDVPAQFAKAAEFSQRLYYDFYSSEEILLVAKPSY